MFGVHLEYFMAIGKFFVYIFTFLVCLTNKNLATLLDRHNVIASLRHERKRREKLQFFQEKTFFF
jgi:hypothetical protein